MYIPPAFTEADPDKLFTFIEQHSFGIVFSQGDSKPIATHMPLLLDRNAGQKGMLLGHFARANPHWQDADGKNVLIVFSGPHAYISPSWYESENVVPTWNYVAVHVYGTFRIIQDESALTQIIRRYVDFYEASMPTPWTFDAEGEFSKKLLKQIVGFHIEITSLEGKWKLNQNHPVERREKVIRALRESGDEQSRAIAELMAKQLQK
jgi:transcriptional regulator